MAKCKCVVCGIEFDRNKEQAVHSKIYARRYSHATCEPDNQDFVPLPTKKEKKEVPPDPDAEARKELLDYCKLKFGEKADYPFIQKQIAKFQAEFGFTMTGMLKTLQYFYDIKHGDPSKSNGRISIIPYTYKDAQNYYYTIWLANQINAEIQHEVLIKPPRIIEIEPPTSRPLKIKLFKLLEDEE